MKSPTLKTENYIIRPFTEEDCLLWQQWDVDSEVQSHMPEPKNEPVDISEQYEYIKECEADKEGYYWSIESNDGTTIGTVSLFEINQHHGSAEIGIVIGDKGYWNRGVSTEVLKEITRYAFEDLNIHYIGAEVESANIAMSKALNKVGFQQDGLFKNARTKNGGRVNVLHFGKNR